MVRLERANALPSIVIRDLNSGSEHAIVFDEAAYSLDIVGGYEFDTTTLRFSYLSMTTPVEIYDYDMASRATDPAQDARRSLAATTRPLRHDAHHGARPHDGAEVPVSILHRRDLAARRHRAAAALRLRLLRHGHAGPASRPTACRWSIAASFMPSRISAAARTRAGAGFSTASARRSPIRFDDFAAAGRALIDSEYTSAKRIVGHGGSAGGMLMGAVANRAGELFAGIVAEVPFVDVLNTMLDDTLPLTPPEWPEWATDHRRSGIPLHPLLLTLRQRRGKAYPAILAMAGLTDPRVTYWEPAKWIARLRATMTAAARSCCAPTWARAMAVGRTLHRLEEVAIAYAFALWAVGCTSGRAG